MKGIAHIAAEWPLVASMAMVLAAQGLRAGRRRSALNEAMHELRRPLQAVALAATGPRIDVPSGLDGSIHLAKAALQRLDREINGGQAASIREVVRCRDLLREAAGRWRARAALGDGSLELRWRAGEARVDGDRSELAQALDNLIVNAIEHGGPEIVLEGRIRDSRLRISVEDSGCASRPASRRGNPAEVIARLSGRRRHGHGLQVVRRTAEAHGGRFWLRHSDRGSLAVLELPLPYSGAQLTA
jgi:signal transduction histidine kinase